MIRSFRNGLMLSATALALVAAPVLLNATPLSDLSAMAGGKGNGNGGGNGNSGGGGSSDHGNSGGNGNGGKSSSEKSTSSKGSKKVASTDSTATAKTKGKPEKVKNLNAQLAGLNSLKRNINGVMNSSDPRMALIRDYITASAELEQAAAELEAANTTLGELQTALDTFVTEYVSNASLEAYDGTDAYADPTLQGLNDRLAALNEVPEDDPNYAAALAEKDALTAVLQAIAKSDESIALAEQQTTVQDLTGEVEGLEALTSEDALKAALLAAANKNRVAEAGGDSYLTPEIMDWATGRIDGLVDQYQAQQ